VKRLWNKIDLHVAVLVLGLAPWSCFGWWGLVILLVVPQGLIITRTMTNRLISNPTSWEQFLANELFVFAVVSVAAGLRLVFSR
jgi:hypothetical protein